MITNRTVTFSATVFGQDVCSAAQSQRKDRLNMARFTNQAQLSYNDTVVNSNITVGEIIESLTVTKTSIGTTYENGSEPVYIISIINTDDEAVTGVTVSDDLGAYTPGTVTFYPLEYEAGSVRLFTNGVLGPAPAVAVGPPLVFSGITIPANGNVIIIYRSTLTDAAPLGLDGEITNTVTVTADELTFPVTASTTITTSNSPRLAITKSMDPTRVSDGDRLTYTFTIENFGNSPATIDYNVTVRDTFLPILYDITVTYNGTTWTTPANYRYSETTGVFATVPGQITVPAATFTQDPATGIVAVTPGVSTLVVTGTVRV